MLGRDAVAAALDLVTKELAPHVATFFTVARDGQLEPVAVTGRAGSPQELPEIAFQWLTQLRWIDPLAAAQIGELDVPVATLADVGGARRVLADRRLLATYRRMGVINDARMLIRDDGRFVAGITLWRLLSAKPWSPQQLGLLAEMQPLIEAAYLSSWRRALRARDGLPAALTRREREVVLLLAVGASNRDIARALGISADTAKSHTRAVLAKLRVTSRRQIAGWLRAGGPLEAPDSARG